MDVGFWARLHPPGLRRGFDMLGSEAKRKRDLWTAGSRCQAYDPGFAWSKIAPSSCQMPSIFCTSMVASSLVLRRSRSVPKPTPTFPSPLESLAVFCSTYRHSIDQSRGGWALRTRTWTPCTLGSLLEMLLVLRPVHS